MQNILFKNVSWMTYYSSLPLSSSTANGKHKKTWLHVKSQDQLPTWFSLIRMQPKPVIIFPTFWLFDIAYFFAVGSIEWIFRYSFEKKNPQTLLLWSKHWMWGWLWHFSLMTHHFLRSLVANGWLFFIDRRTISVDMHTVYRTYLFFGVKKILFNLVLRTYSISMKPVWIHHVPQPNKIERKTATSSSAMVFSFHQQKHWK